MEFLLILWVAFACLAGVYWKGRGLSYWQGFFYSIFLSPILSFLVYYEVFS